eukprot:TRINITY_DN39421_c0_g1_i1.p1 TRINITY_DN39421_c0_g1~~TRINITY_DN39421_c0_g1_i1.p1  ORF type:complete len:1401 (-),score=169.94 TRINITY_DN39421_c0_g1_i1:148-3891(-)
MPEIWAPFLVGGSLVIADGGSTDAAKDIESLAKRSRTASASLVQFVPSVLTAILRSGLDPIGPACRHLVLTGEPLPSDLCRALLVRSGVAPAIRNHYGQTEIADTTTLYEVDQHNLPRTASLPLGRPTAHRHLWLRTCMWDGRSCGECGTPGEIVVAGPGLFSSDSTSGESTLTSPNMRGAGDAFATGDLGRWVTSAGKEVLICLGRRDRQVKVRGHRVELAEIEAALRRAAREQGVNPTDIEAVVSLHVGGGNGDNGAVGAARLVAYVSPASAASTASAEVLLSACKKHLPSYMVPEIVIGIDHWPRLATGKLNRQALPPPQPPVSTTPPSSAEATAAQVHLCSPPISRANLKTKMLQLLRTAVLGAIATRLQLLRAVCLPHAWCAYVGALSQRGDAQRVVGVELRDRGHWTLFFAISCLLPLRPLAFSALVGALSMVFRAGWQQASATPVLWWLGLSSAESTVEGEIRWYSWYLTPGNLSEARAAFGRAVQGQLAAVRRLVLRSVFGDEEGIAHGIEACRQMEMDRLQWRPRKRPKTDSVRVCEEPTALKVRVIAASTAADFSASGRAILAAAEAEAGRPVALGEPLALVFDSLRMMGFVVAARQASGVEVTLRDVLRCDTLHDMLMLPVVQSPPTAVTASFVEDSTTSAADVPVVASPADQGGSRFFRIPEWRYMFGLSVGWVLVPDQPVDTEALQGALQDLAERHEALRVEVVDPSPLLDLAMEAAANLSLAREAIGRLCPSEAGSGGDGRDVGRLVGAVGRGLIKCMGKTLIRAWPRVAVRSQWRVPLETLKCSDSKQLRRRSEWLLDGRNASCFMPGPLHAVILQCEGDDGGITDQRLHILVNHGLCDGFSGVPLLADLECFYAERQSARCLRSRTDMNKSGVATSVGIADLTRKRRRGEPAADRSVRVRCSGGDDGVSPEGGSATFVENQVGDGKQPCAGTIDVGNSIGDSIRTEDNLPRGAVAARKRKTPPSSLALLERRLENALVGSPSEHSEDAVDMCSSALPGGRSDAFDHFVWVSQPSIQTLERIVERRRWCCSVDVALIAALVCALLRARARSEVKQDETLRLRLTVAMRDGPDEGLMVADFTDYRDLDIRVSPGASVEMLAVTVAGFIRHRQWRIPSPMDDASNRIFLNFRPLLEEFARSSGGAFRHQTQWPPVHGERGWDRRSTPYLMWLMADQVGRQEWYFCLRIQRANPWGERLGAALESVLRDLALRPETTLWPPTVPASDDMAQIAVL